MSVEVVRNALLDEKKKQLRSATVARRRVLLGLFRATFNPPSLGAPLSPISPGEEDFLDDNDIALGRYFDEASLPIRDGDLTLSNKDESYLGASDLPSTPISPAGPVSLADAKPVAALQPPEESSHPDRLEPVKADAVRGNEASARPQDVQDPTADDIAQTGGTERAGEHGRPPRTVKLPPREVQERRLEEMEAAQDEDGRIQRAEDDALRASGAGNGADQASSPSSTVGAQSTFTPKALNHSPDTSPDIESRAARNNDAVGTHSSGTPGKDLRADPSKHQASTARTATTADAQLRPDDEEESRRISRARDSELRHMPLKDSSLTQDAQEFVRESKAADRETRETDRDVKDDGAIVAQAAQSQSTEDMIAVKSRPSISRRTEDVEMSDAQTVVPNQSTASLTPARTPSSAQQPPAERMTTRVSSGAIRHKSVSEILGGRPSLALQPPAGNVEAAIDSYASPPSARKTRDAAGPSTALVSRRDSISNAEAALRIYSSDYAALKGASRDSNRDYLIPLFMYQAYAPPRAQPLVQMVDGRSKTVSTFNFQAMLREGSDYRILKRIYQLQNANRWSFRQMEKCPEPATPESHLDTLLAEMKWMRTDFREERKAKVVQARNLAEWCAEWKGAEPHERLALQVKVKRAHVEASSDETPEAVEPPPELIASASHETDSESSLEEPIAITPVTAQHPSSLFSLNYDRTTFESDNWPLTEALLQELPVYKPRSRRENISDAQPTLPVAKLLSGKLVSKSQGPPRKRSRYEYEEEDSDHTPQTPKRRESEDGPYSFTPTRSSPKLDLPPDESDLALFLPENKHVRDRLHAGHAFRPPSEFGMPSTSFFEARSSSQWLWKEDQELRGYVKDFSFNWSLISAEMSSASHHTSGAERRTPWECFERWVQLEGLPAEMSKTQYFRTYQARLEAAARTVQQQHAAAQQASQASAGQLIPPVRRRTTQPFRVERRKNSKYLAAIDGMRKLARKRETQAAKQQENARAAQLRKAAEQQQPKVTMQTPAEFSKLRAERDVKMQERAEQARQQWMLAQQQRQAQMRHQQMQGQPQAAQQAAMAAAAAQQQQQQRNGAMAGVMPNANQQAALMAAAAAAAQNGQVPQGAAAMQQRMMQQQQLAMQNGMPNGSGMPNMQQMAAMQGMPQAQMQALMQQHQQQQQQQFQHAQQQGAQQPRMSPENMRMLMQQRQVANAAAAQQMQNLSQPGNLANAHLAGSAGLNAMQSSQLYKQMAAQMSQQMGGAHAGMMGAAGMSASPRMQQAGVVGGGGPQQLSSGHVPAINQLANQIQAGHPNLSPEQAKAMAAKELQNRMVRQNALNAAAGAQAGGNNNMAGIANMNMNMQMNMAAAMGMGMNGMPMGFGGGGNNGSPGGAAMMQQPQQQQGQGNNGTSSPVQHYNQNLRMQQQQQQAAARQMAGSPAMGMSNLAGHAHSRSATPQQLPGQHQRVRSGSAMESSLSPGGGRPGSMHGSVGGGGGQ